MVTARSEPRIGAPGFQVIAVRWILRRRWAHGLFFYSSQAEKRRGEYITMVRGVVAKTSAILLPDERSGEWTDL
jgi:hypothetical protein